MGEIRMPRLLSRLLALFVVCVFLSAPLQAQTDAPAAPAKPLSDLLNDWKGTLDAASKQLASGKLEDEADFERVRADADRVRSGTQAARADAQAKVAAAQQLVDALGAPPADGSAESKDVARQRQQLATDLAAADGRLKQLDVIDARAQALTADIARALREKLASNLLARGPSLLSADVWTLGAGELLSGFRTLSGSTLDQWRAPDYFSRVTAVSGKLLLVLLALCSGFFLRRWLLAHFGRDASGELTQAPEYSRRVGAALVEALCRALLPSLAAGAIALIGRFDGLVDPHSLPLLDGFTIGLVFYVTLIGLDRAALAPEQPAWRVAMLADDVARRLSWRFHLIAAVFAPLLAVTIAAPAMDLGEEGRALWIFVGSLALGSALLTVSSRRAWRSEQTVEADAGDTVAPVAAERNRRPLLAPLWALLRIAVALIALAGPLLALYGYSNLAAYLQINLLWTGLGLGAVLVLRRLLAELIDRLLIIGNRRGPLARVFALDESSAQRLDFWLSLLFDCALFSGTLVLLLLRWGVRWPELASLLDQLLFGFKVGGMTLSLLDLLTAVALFSGILAASRMTQRVLEERVLPHTRMDAGLRNSIKSAVSYVGLVIGLVVAVSTLGIDLSKIALLAGALSVGIGFGLQNIVSNFVSGLILLAERPIKVGDWVVVGASEGIVKRINVRATEIETAQRASVIIPNSTLLSQSVQNWTHKNTFGRVEIAVGVAYESDPEQVRSILLECAKAHAAVSRWPAPMVVFKDFGPSSLDFELRVYLDNVELKGVVASDLRFAIFRAFSEQGVEIPFGQSEVRLRDIERLETLVERLLENGAARHAPAGVNPLAERTLTPAAPRHSGAVSDGSGTEVVA